MLLGIDVGNTQTVVGVFKDGRLRDHWRISTERERTADEIALALGGFLAFVGWSLDMIDGIIVSSVVPEMTRALTHMAHDILNLEPLVVDSTTDTGIPILYEDPRQVGADRLVNAVAVDELWGGPAIVVDFGTATTFDCISKKGEYLGGVIAPGLEIANEALAARTAKLPRVNFEVPKKVLGTTTKESLQSGLYFGYIALVEGVLTRLSREMRGSPKVIATGGLSSVIGPKIKSMNHIRPALTLEGLQILWERNRKRNPK
jgi:type III pantothenate kinase